MENRLSMEELEKIKSSYATRIYDLKKDISNTKDSVLLVYLNNKIMDLILDIKNNKNIDTKDLLDPIFNRVNNLDDYGKFYEYSFPENLKEQVTIVSDSIRASPLHQKKLEVSNMSITQFKDEN